MSAAPMELLREGSLLGGEVRTVRRNAIAYAPQDAVSFDGKMGQEFSGGERQRLGRILVRLGALRDRMAILVVANCLPEECGIDRVLRLETGLLTETGSTS